MRLHVGLDRKKPKGVVISDRTFAIICVRPNSVYGIGGDDVAFQGASVAFDLSLEEVFIPYLVGAKLWIAGRSVLQETDGWPKPWSAPV